MCWHLGINVGKIARKYRGDLFGAFLAFLFSFLIAIPKEWEELAKVYTFTRPDIAIPLVLLVSVAVSLVVGLKHVSYFFERRMMMARYENPTIQILNGFVGESTNEKKTPLGFTDFDASDWVARFRKEGLGVSTISVSRIESSENVVVNPFGEHYPEESEPNLNTLQKIQKFIIEGGVFINVAGFPFFYSYNTRFEPGPRITGETEPYFMPVKKNDQTVLIPNYDPFLASTLNTWLRKNFGIVCNILGGGLKPAFPVDDPYFKDLVPSDGSVQVEEFRSAVKNTKPNVEIMPIIQAYTSVKVRIGERGKEIKEVRFPCYPISVTKIGMGYFVLIGMHLKKSRSQDFELAVESILTIFKKPKERGYLMHKAS